jgi:hypothetical protein
MAAHRMGFRTLAMCIGILLTLIMPADGLAAEQEHMKVVYAPFLDFLMDVPIAIENGYFKKVGLDFEPIDVDKMVDGQFARSLSEPY